MKSKRFLVDQAIAPVIEDLLKTSKVKFDTVTLKKGMLKSLLRHGNYSALILQSKTRVPTEVLDSAGKNLKVIGVVGDSLGNINITDASRRGILVKAAEYVNAYEAANLSLHLIVRLQSQTFQERGEGKACVITKSQDIVTQDLSGFELAGSTIGLIGCGKVAQSLAKQIAPYCKRVIGYDNDFPSVYENFHKRNPLERPVIEYVPLSEVLEYSNVISIHTAGTEKVFKGKELYYAKHKPFIVNTSRSGHVDEASLLDAIREKRVRGAAILLPSKQIKSGEFEGITKQFLSEKNVLIAPAIGNPLPEKKKKSVCRLTQAVIDFLNNKDLSLAVNPMEVFPGSRKVHYPIAKGRHQSAVPLLSS